MRDDTLTPAAALARLGRPLWLTRIGMVAERITYAFWPLWSICLLIVGLLFMGLHDLIPLEALWTAAVLSVLALLAALIHGIRKMRWPIRAEALDRLDRSLPGRPIAALADTQAIGADDPASQAVWNAHVIGMAQRLSTVRSVGPDLRIAARDPFALRYVAATVFVVALIFGSVWRVSSVTGMAPGQGDVLAVGPSWEGWITPPDYTGKPGIYLNDIAPGALSVPQGSRLSLRFYGQLGALSLVQDIAPPPPASDETTPDDPAARPAEAAAPDNGFEGVIARSGDLRIDGAGGAEWQVAVVPDAPPHVTFGAAAPETTPEGALKLGFEAHDDYGVQSGTATLTLDRARRDRRYGLAVEPEPRDSVVVDLPMTISGDRADFTETLVQDFADHPWAGLPVTITLSVRDALDQQGQTPPLNMTMPGRRFFDPVAASIAEQRRDILWSRENGPRAARIIRAITYLPNGFITNQKGYLLLRIAMRRLEGAVAAGMTVEQRDDVAAMLWQAALKFEEGELSSALDRLRRAQDRLSEAMKNGATNDEIAKLMDELRKATQDYIAELAQQNQRDPNRQQADNQQTREMTGQQLQDMLDRLQELMQQGRMAEAQQLMEQLRRMMENMQVTQGQQGQQSPGQQAMEGLSDTLRKQQGLSDESFQQLQDQFNPGGQPGQPRQGQNQPGQSQGQNPGQNSGQNPGRTPGQSGSLAERQQALRDQLDQQRGNLPGAGTAEGDAARQALERAGKAMDRAEQALRDGQTAEALDGQAEAMDALREGMRNLGDALARQQQQQGQGQQNGMAQGSPSGNDRDPLGRDMGGSGRVGSDENLLQGEDVYRRARELLDEIRRRSGDQSRPDVELDYLRRLLDRF
ncbi:TIGR02302 family protein [Brevirhabdus sp.]|uniref:TIGR02302 family protein n=1 Tax=Brevirhabdus sp. TaxID=2004514 RepID=UPI004058E8EB